MSTVVTTALLAARRNHGASVFRVPSEVTLMAQGDQVRQVVVTLQKVYVVNVQPS